MGWKAFVCATNGRVGWVWVLTVERPRSVCIQPPTAKDGRRVPVVTGSKTFVAVVPPPAWNMFKRILWTPTDIPPFLCRLLTLRCNSSSYKTHVLTYIEHVILVLSISSYCGHILNYFFTTDCVAKLYVKFQGTLVNIFAHKNTEKTSMFENVAYGV